MLHLVCLRLIVPFWKCLHALSSGDPNRDGPQILRTDFSLDPSRSYSSRINLMPPAAVSTVQPSSSGLNIHPCQFSTS